MTRKGRLELICGCMFSGKSERLLARLADAHSRGVPTATFKHASDIRYAERQIVTHNGKRADSQPIQTADEILDYIHTARLIAIDEAQFFGPDIIRACRELVDQGCDVVVAGLDLDSWGRPFGPMPELARLADLITHTYATCARCGSKADHTQRLAPIEGQKMVGGPESYEPRCSQCFVAPPPELRR